MLNCCESTRDDLRWARCIMHGQNGDVILGWPSFTIIPRQHKRTHHSPDLQRRALLATPRLALDKGCNPVCKGQQQEPSGR
jgi:hypothetical protein